MKRYLPFCVALALAFALALVLAGCSKPSDMTEQAAVDLALATVATSQPVPPDPTPDVKPVPIPTPEPKPQPKPDRRRGRFVSPATLSPTMQPACDSGKCNLNAPSQAVEKPKAQASTSAERIRPTRWASKQPVRCALRAAISRRK